MSLRLLIHSLRGRGCGRVVPGFGSTERGAASQVPRLAACGSGPAGVLRRMDDKWLKAGVMEEGRRSYPEAGTPQGGVISPLLANAEDSECLAQDEAGAI